VSGEGAAFGCVRCGGEDAASAWEAMTATRLRAWIQESHFSVRLSACSCGQQYTVVFTERIDWRGGEDDQLWLAVPVTEGEVAALDGAGEGAVGGVLTRLVEGRRFLVRSFPTGGALACWWRDGGFAIGPHD
jgi:hypothetical protein